MNRAGKEPAEDVKRRLISVCTELGYESKGMIHLMGDKRVVSVDASAFNLMTFVPVSGEWPDTVSIRSGTPVGINGPWLQGRLQIPFPDLISELRDTLDEREKVIAAMKCGVAGPYRFERSVWSIAELFQ
jgi:hypothetical protein